MYIQVSGFTNAPEVTREHDGNVLIRAHHPGGGSTYLSLDPAEALSVRDELIALDLGAEPQKVAA